MAVPKAKTEDQVQMDAAAEVAAAELAELDPTAVGIVADWMARHYLKAGYKRLARKLLGTRKVEAGPAVQFTVK